MPANLVRRRERFLPGNAPTKKFVSVAKLFRSDAQLVSAPWVEVGEVLALFANISRAPFQLCGSGNSGWTLANELFVVACPVSTLVPGHHIKHQAAKPRRSGDVLSGGQGLSAPFAEFLGDHAGTGAACTALLDPPDHALDEHVQFAGRAELGGKALQTGLHRLGLRPFEHVQKQRNDGAQSAQRDAHLMQRFKIAPAQRRLVSDELVEASPRAHLECLAQSASAASSIGPALTGCASYLVANAVVLPVSGWLARVVGRKRFYMLCVALFTVGSFLCGLAPNLPMLIVFRVLQGLGGGGMAPSEQSILADTFPQEKRAQAFALYGVAVVVAPTVGPALGGWITDNWSWNWIFFINVPVGIASLLLVQWLLVEPEVLQEERREHLRAGLHIDWVGFVLVALFLGCLEVVLDWSARRLV